MEGDFYISGNDYGILLAPNILLNSNGIIFLYFLKEIDLLS